MESHLREKRKTILWFSLVFIAGALIANIFGTTFSLIQTNRTISNSGSVRGIGVGVYWNSACTNATSSVNWGILDPGSSKTVSVYIRNEGSSAATLAKATQNWNPSAASSYMTLNWNYAGQTLSANQVLQINLILVVSSAVSGITNFGFDIIITASA